jgi:hypothetical protein
MTAATGLALLSIVIVALVVAWNVIQSKRIDVLQKRIEALEKK